jgi:hypothetical protein
MSGYGGDQHTAGKSPYPVDASLDPVLKDASSTEVGAARHHGMYPHLKNPPDSPL